jgi:hypothetical protein
VHLTLVRALRETHPGLRVHETEAADPHAHLQTPFDLMFHAESPGQFPGVRSLPRRRREERDLHDPSLLNDRARLSNNRARPFSPYPCGAPPPRRSRAEPPWFRLRRTACSARRHFSLAVRSTASPKAGRGGSRAQRARGRAATQKGQAKSVERDSRDENRARRFSARSTADNARACRGGRSSR